MSQAQKQSVFYAPINQVIDRDATIAELSARFIKAIVRHPRRNDAGTFRHEAETEFSYLVDEIKRGPNCNIQRCINDINSLIKQVHDAAKAIQKTE